MPEARAGASPSSFDRLIPAEVRGDRFFRWIARIAATPGVRTILEIGSSAGAGSTVALLEGALRNPRTPAVHCIEASRPRFLALAARYRGHAFIHPHHVSSVPADRFPTAADIDAFRRRAWTRFRLVPRATVLGWLRQDLEYLEREGLSGAGIRTIMDRHGIQRWDAVLIDGSEFTGSAEMEEVYGARFLLLDDIRSFKNYDNQRRLAADPAYRRVARSRWLRNGFAIFERRPGFPAPHAPADSP